MQRLMISHSLLDLIKAGGAVPGTRKKRADGHWYIKQANGEWVREKAQRGAKKEDKKEAPRAKAPEGVRGRSAYRALPNGRIVHVPQEFDERKKAARNPEKHKGKVVHADKESTSYVNAQGELKTHKHKPTDFLNEEAIHARLNSILTLDEEFAENYMRVKNGITDYRDFLNELVKAEKQHAKENDRKPEFTDIAGARKHFIKTEVRPALKTIQKEFGEVTTWAKLSQAWPEIMEDLQQEQTDVHPQMRIMAKLAQEHGEDAIESAERQLEQVKKAKAAHPDDCPVIPSLSENITFFGHQAEALAMLNQLDKAIVDVDMGGGKGLLLPADAMNLMAQGKVKKPLIVVPGATLEQNGRKIHEYTDNGMNVFLIDNTVIREIYDGDMEALQKDIEDAPPNTIFMASYDVFSYKPKASDEIDEIEYPRAAALADAGFDMISLDESHNIKNINSGRFKALQHMSHIPIKRVASGTFLSNNPKDVLGQLLFLFPHAAMSEKNFMQKYGFEDSKGGTKWNMDKLKQLREDLQNIGMISLRRSAWMNKLPERKELPRIVKMDKKHAQVNEIIVNEVVDALEDELKKDPRIEKLLEGSDFDTDDDLPPNVLGPLNLLQAITDYPDELARSLKQDIVTYREGKKKEAEDDIEMEESSTLEAIRRRVAQLTPAARKAILSLEGTVSPKALDAYKAMEEHFKDPKNGKFMVFVQRKMAANHVIDNMPEHLKKMAVYYDASKKDALESFVKDPNGPKIIVAVDQSIKEGVNMQVANAQYRYDHHYVPGNQEQGYARIWRFGQDKPAKIYLGLVDGGVDVTKYARLISKLHTNQMVVSNMEDDDTFTAFKLNLNNIRNNRSANQVLPEYFDMNKKMLDYQYGENKQLAKKYGTKTWKRSSPKKIGGKDAKEMHGRGAYLDDIDWKVDASLNNEEKDTLLQHYRERVSRKNKDMAFDRTVEADNFPLLKQIVEMHKSRKKKELHQKTIDDLREIAKDFYGDEYDEGNFNAMVEAADSYLKGKKVKGHKDHNPKDAVTAFFYMKNKPDFATDKELVSDVYYDVEQFRKWALKNKVKLKHIGGGVVEDNEATEKFWKDYEKQHGKFSQKHRDYVHGIASLIDETFGGYEAVKHHHEDEEDQ